MGKAKGRHHLLLVDDHPSVLAALEMLINQQSTLTVVGIAATASVAVQLTRQLNPDLIVMDAMLPEKSGVEATREIRTFNPQAKVVFYSGYAESAEPALAVGAQGFVLKGSPTNLLLQAITVVLSGGVCIDEQCWPTLKPKVLSHCSGELSFLTAEERAVAQLAPLGLTAKEMGTRLKMEVRRVEKVRARLIERLGARNAIGLSSKMAFYFPPDQAERSTK